MAQLDTYLSIEEPEDPLHFPAALVAADMVTIGQFYSKISKAIGALGNGAFVNPPRNQIGPDLLGVTRSRDHQWLVRIIRTPEQLVKEKDPIAAALLKKYKNLSMPNLGVSDAEVQYLLGYIEAQTAARDKETAIGSDPGVTKSGVTGNASSRPNQ